MARFRWLVPLCLVVLSGCSTPAQPAAIASSDSLIVSAGTGHYVGIEVLRGSALLEVTYQVDPHPVDVFIVSDANLPPYRDGRSFIARCSDEVARDGALSCQLETGLYYIVFDNTDYGFSKPAGDTRVTYSYTAE